MAGITFNKMLKFCNILNLQFISKSTYYQHRGDFVYPEIDHAWRKEKEMLAEDILITNRQLALAVDGQCDSPGHNATYSTVSAMDCETNKVLNFKIVHVKETGTSQSMEKEGFIRCIEEIQEDMKLPIRVISTDRHASIKKLM